MKKKLTFGTDPEFVLIDGKGNYKSAITAVAGSKDVPLVIGGNKFYWDNVLAECTVKPATSVSEFVDNIRTALREYAKLVNPLKLKVQASQFFSKEELFFLSPHFDKDTLKRIKEDKYNHPSMQVGCVPEFTAYHPLGIVDVGQVEDQFRQSGQRTCGGHLHLGHSSINKHDDETDNRGYVIVRLLDLILGIPSIFLDKDPTSLERKAIYGKAGRFRRPKHGIEYRSLSNFWLSSPAVVEVVAELSEFAVELIESGRWEEYWKIDVDKINDPDSYVDPKFNPADCHICLKYDFEEVIRAVNNMDKVLGRKVFDSVFRPLVPSKLVKKVEAIANDGYSTDLYREWNI